METNVQTLCTMRIIGSYTFQPLWVSAFTQLRFHCSKQQGRTFHVTTVANSTGEAVVQYFSGQTDAMPYACGSFVRMENDNSRLAGVCDKWGNENGADYVGKWGSASEDDNRLYNHAAFAAGLYHWLLFPGDSRWECDDAFVWGVFWRFLESLCSLKCL